MADKKISRPVALIVALIFYFASVIVFWKIIADGSTTQRMISAIGFAVAGVLWTIIYLKSKNAKDQNT